MKKKTHHRIDRYTNIRNRKRRFHAQNAPSQKYPFIKARMKTIRSFVGIHLH